MDMHLHYRVGDSRNFARYAFQRCSVYWNLHYGNGLYVLKSALSLPQFDLFNQFCQELASLPEIVAKHKIKAGKADAGYTTRNLLIYDGLFVTISENVINMHDM
jgi:hypothetical protein